MKPGFCGYCEDPLVDTGAVGFCDDLCKDLHSRSLKKKRPYANIKNSAMARYPSSERDVIDQKKRFDPVSGDGDAS